METWTYISQNETYGKAARYYQNALEIQKQGEKSSAFRFYIIMNIAMVLELAIEY